MPRRDLRLAVDEAMAAEDRDDRLLRVLAASSPDEASTLLHLVCRHPVMGRAGARLWPQSGPVLVEALCAMARRARTRRSAAVVADWIVGLSTDMAVSCLLGLMQADETADMPLVLQIAWKSTRLARLACARLLSGDEPAEAVVPFHNPDVFEDECLLCMCFDVLRHGDSAASQVAWHMLCVAAFTLEGRRGGRRILCRMAKQHQAAWYRACLILKQYAELTQFARSLLWIVWECVAAHRVLLSAVVVRQNAPFLARLLAERTCCHEVDFMVCTALLVDWADHQLADGLLTDDLVDGVLLVLESADYGCVDAESACFPLRFIAAGRDRNARRAMARHVDCFPDAMRSVTDADDPSAAVRAQIGTWKRAAGEARSLSSLVRIELESHGIASCDEEWAKLCSIPEVADAIEDTCACPITHMPIKHAVIANDGHRYEKQALLKWVRAGGTSPLTRQIITQVKTDWKYISWMDAQLSRLIGQATAP